LRKAGLAALTAAIGGKLMYAENIPEGMVPLALQNYGEDEALKGKHPEVSDDEKLTTGFGYTSTIFSTTLEQPLVSNTVNVTELRPWLGSIV
jgi:hypothetical protein